MGINMKIKKIICMGMAAIFAASALAGCGKGGEEKVSKSWEDAPKVYYAISNSWESQLGKTGDDYEDNPYTRYIFEKTGIRMVPVLLSGDQAQQLALKRAGGDRLDLIVNKDIVQSYMQSGLIVPVGDLLDKYKNKAPNIQKNIPESAWKGATKIDTVWGIPSRAELPNAPINYMFFRKDWMDKLGLEMPKTMDDVGNILKAFTKNDPDGNGIDDTYGLCYKGSNTVNSLMLFFGVDTWREEFEGDKLVSQAMTDRARKAYSKIREWDKAGYICHDGITDTKANEQLVGTNRVGTMISSGGEVKKLSDVLHDNGYTEAAFALCTNQITSTIDNKFYGWNRSNNWKNMVMITSMAQDHENIFKLLNWLYSEEGTFFQSYGIEGREYTMKDGKPVVDKEYRKKMSYLDMYAIGKSYNTYYPELAELTYGSDEFGKQYIEETINNADNYYTDRTDIKFQYPDLSSFTTYPSWRKGVETNMLKFTSGDLDPADDTVWNNYLSECESYGIQKLMDEAAERYKKEKK